MFGSPSRYDKEISVRGDFSKYLGMPGPTCHLNACVKDLLKLFKYQIGFPVKRLLASCVGAEPCFPAARMGTHRMLGQPLTDGLTSVLCLHITVDSVRLDGGVRLDEIHFGCLPSFPNDLLTLCKKASLCQVQGQKHCLQPLILTTLVTKDCFLTSIWE